MKYHCIVHLSNGETLMVGGGSDIHETVVANLNAAHAAGKPFIALWPGGPTVNTLHVTKIS